MISTNPRFKVIVLDCIPVGHITHAVSRCPRCQRKIAITRAMREGVDSIICKGNLAGVTCNGHYYLRGNELEFVGTV